MAHRYFVLRDKLGEVVAATVLKAESDTLYRLIDHAQAQGVHSPFWTTDWTDEPPILMSAIDDETERAILADCA